MCKDELVLAMQYHDKLEELLKNPKSFKVN